MYSREEVEGGWVINEVCNFPIEQMHVTSDGNAVVCPNDFDGAEVTLGNIIENSLIQFSCELDFMTSVTDHTLFAANITKVNSNDSSPLVWHKSNFYDL